MKKLYLILVFVAITCYSFSQSIVVLDRENVSVGSAPTANVSGVSSIGLTRGSGISQATSNNANHTSNGWDSTSLLEATAAGEYIEWSVTASPTFVVNVSDLDLRVRRNNSGPANFQIFYSTDGFTSSSIDISGVIALGPNANRDISLSGLGITSTGTLTFRVYAWHNPLQANQSGWFRFVRNGSLSDLGNTNVCARISGSAVSTSTNSRESDIIRSTSFNEPENIDYINYNATSGLQPVAPPDPNAAIKVAEFTIRDGGSAGSDSDSDPTVLEAITFEVSNFSYIQALAIYSGGLLMQEVTTIEAFTTFDALNSPTGIVAPDDSFVNFDVYATFTPNVVDKGQFQLKVNSALNPTSGSSLFAFGDAADGTGGAETSLSGDANRIDVIAGSLAFIQNSSDVNQFEPMLPEVVVEAVDANGNRDIDFNNSLIAFDSSSAPDIFEIFDTTSDLIVPTANGVGSFSNLRFSELGNLTFDVTTFDGPIFPNITSDIFFVDSPLFNLVIQDFDGSGPEWNYTNNVDFFTDGTWEIDPYYGPIDLAVADNMNFFLFSNNILGESQLNDTANGNGTTGFATVTFDIIDVTGFEGVKMIFDWQVIGYEQNRNDVRYGYRINGSSWTNVTLFDGNGTPTDGNGRVIIDVPDGSSTVQLRVQKRNWLLTGFSGFDNFRVAANFDGLIYRNFQWFPSEPNASTGDRNVIISNGTYTVDSPIAADNMVILNGAGITVDPGQSVEANGSIFNNGSFTLNSSSTQYSSLVSDSYFNNGSTNYNRYVGISGRNDLIGLPLFPTTGVSFDEFIGFGDPDNASKLRTNGSLYLFGPFDRAANQYINFEVAATDALEQGIGYRAATTVGETLSFEGSVTTSDVTGIAVSKPAGGSQWNLLGNPYPSYIDSQAFIAANSSVMDPTGVAIYGYNGGTGSPSGSDTLGNFTIINNVANSSTNIAPGQGFFIAVDNTNGFTGSIDFSRSMRTTTGNDDFILGRNTPIEPLNFRLQLENSDERKTTDIYFHDNASLGLDPGYDAATYGGNPNGFAVFSHLVEENEGRAMAIQTLGMDDLTNVRIPIGVNVGPGQQLKFGMAYSNLPEDVEVYLEDTALNSFTLLNVEDYVTSSTNSINGTGRFYMVFGSNALSNSQLTFDTVQIFSVPGKQIVIRGYTGFEGQMDVFDLSGRKVSSNTLTTAGTQEFNMSQLSTGVYIIQLTSEGQQKTEKLILK